MNGPTNERTKEKKEKERTVFCFVRIFKVFVNPKNIVPFRFVVIYNVHVPLVILLQKDKKQRINFETTNSNTNLQVCPLHAVVVELVQLNILHAFQPEHADKQKQSINPFIHANSTLSILRSFYNLRQIQLVFRDDIVHRKFYLIVCLTNRFGLKKGIVFRVHLHLLVGLSNDGLDLRMFVLYFVPMESKYRKKLK